VRRWQLAGQDVNEKFRGLFVSEETIHDLLRQPLGGNWSSIATISPEEDQQYENLQLQVNEEIKNKRKEAKDKGITLQLDQIVKIFNLNEFELDSFLICLAPCLDARYEKIYGFLQDDVTNKYASPTLIFDLLLNPDINKLVYLSNFYDSSSLLKNKLITKVFDNQSGDKPLIKQNFIVPDEIIAWLIGDYQPDRILAEALEFYTPVYNDINHQDLVDLPDDIEPLIDKKPLMVLYGKDELQKQKISEYLASINNQSLLILDINKAFQTKLSISALISVFSREIKLSNALPVIVGLDQVPENNSEINTLIQSLSELDETTIIFTNRNWPIIRKETEHIKPVYWLDCKNPTSGKRIKIWKQYLGKDSVIDENELEILANQFNLSATQIQNIVYSAHDLAFKKGKQISIEDLYEATRFYSSHHLNHLATKIHPRYQWEDIVLPEDGINSLRELANTIRWRSVVLDEWGVGKRLMPYAGVSALFAGPPGTGKTLAAQVIAADLRMDLYKIDLSTVVSKYIGETEKNLERIFSQAKNSNAILFFDEADSIFGKRSEVKDAHDRYANIEVGYLLQRMETYDGVVILATNLRSNMDDAFTRRIQFIVDFPFPDEKERQQIWNVLFPPEVPRMDDIDLDEFGNRYKLTGGSIRNVIISASFLAASENSSVTNHHLNHAIRREMQKMGRLVQDQDLLMAQKEGNNGKNSK
jgi:SpoVK/Ycf46/Vps4 family AAA+-type ATPase